MSDIASAPAMQITPAISRILLADSRPEFIGPIRDAARNARAEFLHAATVPEAIRICTEYDLTLILLSVEHPALSGFEMASRLRACRRQQKTPVLFLCDGAVTQEALNQTAPLDAADCFPLDPARPGALSLRLRFFLTAAQERDRLAEQNRQLEAANAALREQALHRLREKQQISVCLTELEHALSDRTAELERVRHDLRQFAYVAAQELGEMPQSASAAASDLKRIQGLLNGMVAYSQISGGRLESVQGVSLDAVLSLTLLDLAVPVADAQAKITFEPLPEVTCDPVLIGLVFRHLIANSLRFRGSEHPVIHISGERTDEYCHITVRDNGPGIPPGCHERIFEVCTTLHGGEFRGNGMGLALCRRIVEAHGGRIFSDPETASGALFRIALPV